MDRLQTTWHRWIICGWLLSLVVSGCAQPPEETPTAVPTDIPTTQMPPAEPTETPAPTPTPRPTSTPLPPSLTADYQVVLEDGVLIVDELTTPEDGWLVVYPDRQGILMADAALGFAAVTAGRQSDIEVVIDPQWSERTVQVALHGGRSEDEEETLTATNDTLLLLQMLEIDTPATVPVVEVADQEILEDGVLQIERVSIPEPGWLAIYPTGDLTQLLGYAPLAAGETAEVPVAIRWREASDTLQAVILQDLGEPGVFEPEVDQPFEILGDNLQADFEVIFPPEIVIFNQPIVNGRFAVERATTPVDGWLVVYEDEDEDGQPGFIIGSLPIAQGVNENLIVEINQTAVVDQLLVTFHEDTGEIGTFDFPGSDPPQRYQELAFFAPFRTDQGSIVMTTDQSLEEDQVTVPLVISDLNCWVVLYEDEGGQPGSEVIGLTWVAAGLHRAVVVDLESTPQSEVLHVILHSDNGVREEFEPGLTDFPLVFNRRQVAASFQVIR